MQFEFYPRLPRTGASPTEPLWVGGRAVTLVLVRHPRARRYILRLRADGVARVTIPRGGSEREARQFAVRHEAWIERQLLKHSLRVERGTAWRAGTEVLFRGETVKLADEDTGEGRVALLGDQRVRVPEAAEDLRPAVTRHLWQLARQELPPRVFELAAQHQLLVRRVTVRNQRSRWGSCSPRGVISLNWRLVQAPAFVRDYLIVHELMHLRQMNHSPRFWSEVERACPDYGAAEKWLRGHAYLLR